jgi:hypothetical protein
MSVDILENKVASSGLITLNLEDFADNTPKIELDIKPWLFREMILREKDFREFVKAHDWSQYQDQIVPTWAYMLLSVSVQPYAKRYFFGSTQMADELLFHEALHATDFSVYQDVRVIVKGCGERPIPVNAYVEITAALLPFAKSIMYGEACSNVPVFKRK